ncbi:MAG: hypothetical protein MUC97_01295 [Bernardetiaceae bacterium]|jgi:hypothetical protein|nr:hypothetical protein [Bernardetiaceae bacterium]
MKVKVLRTLLAFGLWVNLVGCSGETGQSGTQGGYVDEELLAEAAQGLKNAKRATQVADRYFEDQAFKVGKASLAVMDKDAQVERHPGVPRAYEETTKQVGPLAAVLGVTMVDVASSNKDTLLVDFKMEWDRQLLDGKGDMKVTDLQIRKVGSVERYRWEKAGNYWKKATTQALAPMPVQ